MRKLFLFVFMLLPFTLSAQSKSINRFRSDFKENSNMFFYTSTLKMLNTENNTDFAAILDGIEEIMVLNYKKSEQKFDREDLVGLKNSLEKEAYNTIMMINDNNSSINVFSREKKGRMTGLVAIFDNQEELVLIDLTGYVDIKKFMDLKKKLDTKTAL